MKSLKEFYLKFKKRKILFFLVKSFIGILVIGFSLLFLLFALVYFNVFGQLPDEEKLATIINEEATLVYSSDEILIGKVFAENRTNVKSEQIPTHLKNALIATEDKRFYEHIGYDSRSYLRVFFKSILMGDESAGGGSTITQQLIKNLYGRQYTGFLSLPINKIKELITAKRIEKIYSKDEILLLYLNSVPFGENSYGIESASNRFFNKSVNQLKIEESAVLIGMLKANTFYNPRINPKNALNRRNTVIELMEVAGYIGKNSSDSLQQLPLTLDYKNLNLNTTAGYFVYKVKQNAAGIIANINEENDTDYNLETDGLTIHTTLNYKLQVFAEQAAKEQLRIKQKQLDHELRSNRLKAKWLKKQEKLSETLENDKLVRKLELFDWDSTMVTNGNKFDSLWHYEKMLNAAILITHPKDGAILAWVGGNNFRQLPFDMVLSHRQIASAFKPILYATAIENGFSPCDYLENEEKTFPKFDDWTPKNADHSSTPDSKVALWFALIHSMNLPTVDLYFKLKKEALIQTCEKFDFPKIVDNAPSIALGTLDLSLSEIINAYGTFANNGAMHAQYMIDKITDKEGNVIFTSKVEKGSKILKTNTCQALTAILQKAVDQGTGSRIRNSYKIKSQLASKTGTAQNYSDAWFIAYTPDIVIGTWVGTSKNSIHFSSGKGAGSALALPIVANILKKIESDKALKNKYLTNFNIPQSILESLQCPPYKLKGIKGVFNRLFKSKKE